MASSPKVGAPGRAYVPIDTPDYAKQVGKSGNPFGRAIRWLRHDRPPLDRESVKEELAKRYGISFKNRLSEWDRRHLENGKLTQKKAARLEQSLKDNVRLAAALEVNTIPTSGAIRNAGWAKECALKAFNAFNAAPDQEQGAVLSEDMLDALLTNDVGLSLRNTLLGDPTLFANVEQMVWAGSSIEDALYTQRGERETAQLKLYNQLQEKLTSKLAAISAERSALSKTELSTNAGLAKTDLSDPDHSRSNPHHHSAPAYGSGTGEALRASSNTWLERTGEEALFSQSREDADHSGDSEGKSSSHSSDSSMIDELLQLPSGYSPTTAPPAVITPLSFELDEPYFFASADWAILEIKRSITLINPGADIKLDEVKHITRVHSHINDMTSSNIKGQEFQNNLLMMSKDAGMALRAARTPALMRWPEDDDRSLRSRNDVLNCQKALLGHTVAALAAFDELTQEYKALGHDMIIAVEAPEARSALEDIIDYVQSENLLDILQRNNTLDSLAQYADVHALGSFALKELLGGVDQTLQPASGLDAVEPELIEDARVAMQAIVDSLKLLKTSSPITPPAFDKLDNAREALRAVAPRSDQGEDLQFALIETLDKVKFALTKAEVGISL